jgi:hypothetical protein
MALAASGRLMVMVATPSATLNSKVSKFMRPPAVSACVLPQSRWRHNAGLPDMHRLCCGEIFGAGQEPNRAHTIATQVDPAGNQQGGYCCGRRRDGRLLRFHQGQSPVLSRQVLRWRTLRRVLNSRRCTLIYRRAIQDDASAHRNS